jgi:hypothetical protein
VDRTELSEAIVRELGELFVSEPRQAGPEVVAADLDGIEHRLQELSRRVLGRVVEGVVSAIAAGQSVDRPACGTCQQTLRAVDPARPRALQGLGGDYRLRRAYFVCDRCGHGVAPLDERLGLGPGALSPGLARVVCRVGIAAGFGSAADLLEETRRVDVATAAVRRMTEGIGAVAEAEQQTAIALAQVGQPPPPDAAEAPPAALGVEVDGVHVHAGGDWHELKVGLVAPLGPTTRIVKETGRVALTLGRQRACAGFETAALFWYRVSVAACQRGLLTPELALVVVLGDGADWIWRYAWQFLGRRGVEVVEIVDLCLPRGTRGLGAPLDRRQRRLWGRHRAGRGLGRAAQDPPAHGRAGPGPHRPGRVDTGGDPRWRRRRAAQSPRLLHRPCRPHGRPTLRRPRVADRLRRH